MKAHRPKSNVDPKPITAQPIGKPFAVDGTISLKESHYGKRHQRDYDSAHLEEGCYRRMPYFFN